MLQAKRAWVAAVVVFGTGCPFVVNPDVQGPHSEHLTEIQCSQVEQCFDFARKTCGGDYDVVSQNSAGQGFLTITMMVNCAPARRSSAPVDAGP